MVACRILGATTVRRGDVAGHRAWTINLVVAEWVIRHQNGAAPSIRPNRAAQRSTPVGAST